MWPSLSVTSTASCCGLHLIQDDGGLEAINVTALIYLQTLVRPDAPAWAPCSITSADRLVPPSLSANKGRTAKLRLCSGASVVEQTSDQCQDNRVTPSSAKDSRLTCSNFTSTMQRVTHPRTKTKQTETYIHLIPWCSSYYSQTRAWNLFPSWRENTGILSYKRLYFIISHHWPT